MSIQLLDVNFSKLSVSDYGKVFYWGGRIFRGIKKERIDDVLELFNSGLMAELIDKGLFVDTQISALKFESFDLVLEHKLLDVVTYPKEWTFDMLKDAALLVLEINEVAKKYQYKTIDCHGYNVLFSHSRPIFIDFGSFKKSNNVDEVLAPYHEFLRAYIYPLKIWALCGPYFGARSTPHVGEFIPVEAYLKFRYPLLRRINGLFLNRLFQFIHAVRTIQYRDLTKLNRDSHRLIFEIINKIPLLKSILSRPAKIKGLRRSLSKINQRSNGSYWADYHDKFTHGKAISKNPRFAEIEKKLIELNVQSITEIAGNQGAFCLQLEESGLKKIICTDGDPNALNVGYVEGRSRSSTIDWAVLNPFGSEVGVSEASPAERFCSEAVVALALTHHLILSQHIGMEKVLDILSLFTSKYIFVEFMPLGLHNGIKAPPIPDWYTLENFTSTFTNFFKLIEVCKLEENRVLLIGIKE